MDNSCRGTIHVLWCISGTTIATASCCISNEKAHFTADNDTICNLMKTKSKKMQILNLFFIFLNTDILLIT